MIRKYQVTLSHPKAKRIEILIEFREKKLTEPAKDIYLEPISQYTELSIVGEMYYREDFQSPFNCGQLENDIHKMFFTEPFKDLLSTLQKKALSELLMIWDRWHLNGMRAGNAVQNKILDKYREAHPKWNYDYDKCLQILEERDAVVSQGYRYGTAWLVEVFPQNLEAKINDLVKVLNEK